MTVEHDDLDPEDFLRLARDLLRVARDLRSDVLEIVDLEWLSTADVPDAAIYGFAEHLSKWPQGIAAAILAIAVERLDAGDVGTGALFLRIFHAMAALEEMEPEPDVLLH